MLFAATAGTEVALLGVGVEALVGVEAVEAVSAGGTTFFAEQQAAIQEILSSIGAGLGL